MSSILEFQWYQDNSALFRLRNLINQATGAAITDQDGVTITALIYPVGGVVAVNVTPITFAYASALAQWNGVAPSDYGVTLGQKYDAALTIDGGSTSYRGLERLRFKVVDRYADTP